MDCYVINYRACNSLLRQYLAYSQFFLVRDSYVSISCILNFPLKWIEMLRKQLAHSQLSLDMDCYVNISRIVSSPLKWIVTLISRAFSTFS